MVQCVGVDHGGTVMMLGSKDRDLPPDITQALLVIALRRAHEMEQMSRSISDPFEGGKSGGKKEHKKGKKDHKKEHKEHKDKKGDSDSSD